MKDLIVKFAYSILHMDISDPHDIPFALPLVFAAVIGFVLAFIMLQFIGNEKKIDNKAQD